MENDCKVMEFLQLFEQIINHNLKGTLYHIAFPISYCSAA